MRIDWNDQRWAAWRELLSDFEPLLDRMGDDGAMCLARGDVEALLHPRDGLTVGVTTGLQVWAVPRALLPMVAPAFASGDGRLDEAVALLGDERVLAALDAETRDILRAGIGHWLRIDKGRVWLAPNELWDYDAPKPADALARAEAVAGRLSAAAERFDRELAALLSQELDAGVCGMLMERFASHPAVLAHVARDASEELPAVVDVEASLELLETPTAPMIGRFRAGRLVLATLSGELDADWHAAAPAALARVVAANFLPAALRQKAIARMVALDPASLGVLQNVTIAANLAGVVGALRDRDPLDFAAVLVRARAATSFNRAWIGLAPADTLFVANAFRVAGHEDLAIGYLVTAWRTASDAPHAASLYVPGVVAIGLPLERVLRDLGSAHHATIAPFLVANAADIAHAGEALQALLPLVSGVRGKIAMMQALVGLGDASATAALVGALDTPSDEVVDAAIAALARIGDARALKPLERRSDGLFRSAARKQAARDAADAVRARHGDVSGGLSMAGASGGGLSLSEEP